MGELLLTCYSTYQIAISIFNSLTINTINRCGLVTFCVKRVNNTSDFLNARKLYRATSIVAISIINVPGVNVAVVL